MVQDNTMSQIKDIRGLDTVFSLRVRKDIRFLSGFRKIYGGWTGVGRRKETRKEATEIIQMRNHGVLVKAAERSIRHRK